MTEINALDLEMQKRNQMIQQRFGDVLFAGVSNTELKAILVNVKSYWSSNVRAALTLLSCEAVGGTPEMGVDAAVLLNLADAGISIHDDLIDHSPKKHLRTTVVGAYGTEKAVLIGDLLIIKAWSLLQEILRKTEQPRLVLACSQAYSQVSIDMCESQFIELSCRGNLEVDLSIYEEMLWKANSGIKACAELGAILGGGTAQEIRALSGVGRSLALMLALKDEVNEVLNVHGSLPHRLQFESAPLPLLYAAKTSSDRCLRIKEQFGNPSTPEDVRRLLCICFEAEAFFYISGIACEETKKAEAHLSLLSNNHSKELLRSLIFKINREIIELCNK
jgi:geranylgeranyl diphosphate synthase, type I